MEFVWVHSILRSCYRIGLVVVSFSFSVRIGCNFTGSVGSGEYIGLGFLEILAFGPLLELVWGNISFYHNKRYSFLIDRKLASFGGDFEE